MQESRKRPVEEDELTSTPNKKVKNAQYFFEQACTILKTALQKYSWVKKWHPNFGGCGIKSEERKNIIENLKKCVEINPKHAFSHFMLAQVYDGRVNEVTVIEHFVQFFKFVDKCAIPKDTFLWPKTLTIVKENAHLRLASRASKQKPFTKAYAKIALKHFEARLLLKPNAECRDDFIKILKKKIPNHALVKIFKVHSFKQAFTLSGENIREICHRFGLLTPGLQNYIKSQYVDTYFAMKEFVKNEKAWLVTFVHPFCDEEFPVSVTEEILEFTYPL
jgi:hypothetical protein